jgi:hypothetical protein
VLGKWFLNLYSLSRTLFKKIKSYAEFPYANGKDGIG